MSEKYNTIALAITGASGAQYGLRLLECLLMADKKVYLMISRAAQVVIATETDTRLPSQRADMKVYFLEKIFGKMDQNAFEKKAALLDIFGKDQWMAPVASGTGAPDAMVVCPCSTGTLSSIAVGACDNLIERAADVCLKERKNLILVPRETPYSDIHLENMLRLSRMNVCILPASPGFYQKPQTVNDMVDFVVARILNHLNIEQSLLPDWGKQNDQEIT